MFYFLSLFINWFTSTNCLIIYNFFKFICLSNFLTFIHYQWAQVQSLALFFRCPTFPSIFICPTEIQFPFSSWIVPLPQSSRIGLTESGYLSTLTNLTLTILFSKMLKFSKIISSKSKNMVKDNSEYFGIFYLLKWIFQN